MQIIVDRNSKIVICTNFTNGKKHDFRLFKESKIHINQEIKVITDTEYQGLKKVHTNSELSKKKSKKNPLSKEDKKKKPRNSKDKGSKFECY